jgi:hypothetical protein
MTASVLRHFIGSTVLLSALCSAAPAAEAVNIWLNVPFVKQQKDGCGAAAISMVMQYWEKHQDLSAGPVSDYDHIQSALYSPRAHGIYASAMERYFRQNGYRVFAFSGGWPAHYRAQAGGGHQGTALRRGGWSRRA